MSDTVEEYELAQLKRSTRLDIHIICYFFGSAENDSDEIKSIKQKINDDGVLYAEGLSLENFGDQVFKHFGQLAISVAKSNNSISGNSISKKEHHSISVAVAVHTETTVVVVRRSSKSTIGVGLWQIPGGSGKRRLRTASQKTVN